MHLLHPQGLSMWKAMLWTLQDKTVGVTRRPAVVLTFSGETAESSGVICACCYKEHDIKFLDSFKSMLCNSWLLRFSCNNQAPAVSRCWQCRQVLNGWGSKGSGTARPQKANTLHAVIRCLRKHYHCTPMTYIETWLINGRISSTLGTSHEHDQINGKHIAELQARVAFR